MDLRQRTRVFCMYVILCACIMRLCLTGIPAAVREFLFPIYSETGRNVRFSSSSELLFPLYRESPPPRIPVPEKPEFTPEDAVSVEVDYDCLLRPDLEALIQQPLCWNLTGEAPTVLILHTHTTESYTQREEVYTETSPYRTLEEAHNMLSIGDAVAEELTRAGISVIHDRQVHDYPSYSGSYVHARASTQEILKEYPSICLVLDLHRDALERDDGQLRTLAEVEGKEAAQLMIVAGTNVSRQSHRNWEENLSLALKLHVRLERLSPGIMRPLNLRAQRFNQDLSPGALIVEVGAAGNTRQEALAAAEKLAEAVISLALGTE